MKKQILMLVIGILIGAIITTGVFLVLQNSNQSARGEPPTSMDESKMRERPSENIQEENEQQENTINSNETNS